MYFAITCTNVDYFKICELRALEMNMIVVIVVSIAADDNDTNSHCHLDSEDSSFTFHKRRWQVGHRLISEDTCDVLSHQVDEKHDL